MSAKGRESAQRLLAIIVIVAMLIVMGIPPAVVIFFAVVTYFIWRAVQHTEQQETGRVFEFYIDANNILREEERRWYGYEILRVIERGENILHAMPDPPPLVYFSVGALYHHMGDYQSSADYLSYVVENSLSDERHRVAPSTELRRYVHILRKLEQDPAVAPQTLSAMRSLERARRTRAAFLLAESRERLSIAEELNTAPRATALPPPGAAETAIPVSPTVASGKFETPPPPIAEVLRDVYEEKKRTA